jgi:hypothetical protein
MRHPMFSPTQLRLLALSIQGIMDTDEQPFRSANIGTGGFH